MKENTRLFSSSLDETIRLEDFTTEDCLKSFVTPRPYEGMDITGAIELTEAEVTTLYP